MKPLFLTRQVSSMLGMSTRNLYRLIEEKVISLPKDVTVGPGGYRTLFWDQADIRLAHAELERYYAEGKCVPLQKRKPLTDLVISGGTEKLQLSIDETAAVLGVGAATVRALSTPRAVEKYGVRLVPAVESKPGRGHPRKFALPEVLKFLDELDAYRSEQAKKLSQSRREAALARGERKRAERKALQVKTNLVLNPTVGDVMSGRVLPWHQKVLRVVQRFEKTWEDEAEVDRLTELVAAYDKALDEMRADGRISADQATT
jgi:predicted DNA-binding transcriptional regulator AlpA